MTVLVWVLVINFGGSYNQGAVVVDNIATAQSCEQMAKVWRGRYDVQSAICAPVRKVK